MHDISKNVNSIRSWLKENQLDAFIVPHDDEYLSEYIPPENERLAWITGFTGSAGIAIITNDSAMIFVDGRYTVQVKDQVDKNIYNILHLTDNPLIKWLKENFATGTRLGYDPRLHRLHWVMTTKKQLAKQVDLIPIRENPIDLFWDARPSGNNTDKALLLNEKYTGIFSQIKREGLGKGIAKNKCDAAFITQLDSIAWLLNIRGNDVPCNPVLLCHGLLHSNGSFDLFIDENKIPNGFHDHVGKNVTIIPPESINSHMEKYAGKIIQLDAIRSNAWSHNLIIDSGATIINRSDPCTLPKACKNDVEIQGMQNCHIRDAVAVCNFLCWFDQQIDADNLLDEGSLSDKLDAFRAELDLFKGISFGTISAAGKNAAMCHYNHKNKNVPSTLQMDSVYLVDSGGQYLDGTTDITRTIGVGNPSNFIKKTFTLVLKGHIALASARFPEGIAGQHLDTFARQFLWHEGLDFDHGTGHGVGSYLNVHEGPQGIGKGANNVPFKEGMVVSNEPGYYCENAFGIRLENLIYVKKIKEVDGKKLLGFDNLTYVPYDTRLLDMALLTKTEINWINDYHEAVIKKVGPHLDSAVLEWLKTSAKLI